MCTRRFTLFAAALLVAAAGCVDPVSPPDSADEPDPANWAPSLSVVTSAPAVCGDPTEVGLMVGPRISSGAVDVTNDESNLYVTFRSDSHLSIRATALFVGDSPDDIPTTRRGTPRLFRFPYRSGHARGTNEVVWEIPLEDVSGEDAVIAAFALVGFLPSWGDGEPIRDGRGWATYFTHAVAQCAAERIDQDGGEVETADGRLSLSVPAGALQEAVDITVEPATIDDLLEHAGNQSGAPVAAPSGLAMAPTLPPVFGVTPIASTIWNLGPDGLEFATPSTIVLGYDEADLPDGVPEAELGAFVINGIFERAPAIVDTDANTVTAEIEHFSFVFVGHQPPASRTADFRMSALGVSGLARVGFPLTFSSFVTNAGPDGPAGGTVFYRALGDVALGDTPDGCEEVDTGFPGIVSTSCTLDPVVVGGFDPGTSFEIVAQSTGDITVSARVVVDGGFIDDNPANDESETLVSITGELGAEVAMTGISVFNVSDPSEIRVGAELDFVAEVRNNGPQNFGGGTLTYHALGDVVLRDPSLCTEIPSIFDISLECNVNGVVTGGFANILPFRLEAQSVDNLTVWAILDPDDPDTDPDPNNNEEQIVVDVLRGQVDLSPTLTVLGGPQANTVIDVTTRLFNPGPDRMIGATVTFLATGVPTAVVALGGDCTEVADPQDSDIEVTCDVGLGTLPPVITLLPSIPGDLQLSVTTNPGPEQTDLNPANDTSAQTLTVTPAG